MTAYPAEILIKRIIYTALFGLVLILAPSAQALALANDDAPVLREQIKVYSGTVTLGDIFDNAAPSASAPVFRSPDLGTKGIVAAKRVAAAARQHGLHWNNPGGVTQIAIERPSRVVTLKEITRALTHHAMGEFGLTSTQDLLVELSPRSRPFHINARIKGPISVKRLSLRTGGGAFETVIGFDDPEFTAQDKRYRGRAYETMMIPVPAHPIERGQTIRQSDIKIIRMPRTRISAGIVMAENSLAGMAARRNLRIDQPVRRADLERPRLVRRNTPVTIIYKIPGLALKSLGRALADASHGEMVSVENVRSKRTIQATVLGPNLVSVASAINHVRNQRITASNHTGQTALPRARISRPRLIE